MGGGLAPGTSRGALDEAGGAGVVTPRIQVGAKNGLSPTREGTVTRRQGRGDGTPLGWVARSTVKSSLHPPSGPSLACDGDGAIPAGAPTGGFKG